jgi:hypothetical protein
MIDLPAPPPPGAAPERPVPSVAEAAAKRQAMLLALLGPAVLWVVGMAVVVGVASPDNEAGQCEGIGWGCTLPPQDAAILVAFAGAFTLVPVLTAVNALLLLLEDPARRRAIVTSLSLLGALLVVILFAALTA